MRENSKLLHLLFSLFHKLLGSDLTNTSYNLLPYNLQLFIFFFTAAAKSITPKSLRQRTLRAEGEEGEGNPFALKRCAPEDVILVPRWRIS